LDVPMRAPDVKLSLDLMEIGLSPRYGASWRERMQLLLERIGPFRLSYLEGLLRAADCRASKEEDQPIKSREDRV
jgi:CRISPR-associated endonuclease/helicase Cas3